MLDSAPRDAFEEWKAYHSLNPWGDDWERSSLMTARLLNTLRAMAAGFGGEKLKESDLIEDDAFVRKIRRKKRAGGKRMTPRQGFALMRQRIGA